jgi:hypothetical protein
MYIHLNQFWLLVAFVVATQPTWLLLTPYSHASPCDFREPYGLSRTFANLNWFVNTLFGCEYLIWFPFNIYIYDLILHYMCKPILSS